MDGDPPPAWRGPPDSAFCLGYRARFPQLFKASAFSQKKRKRAAQLGLAPAPSKNAVVALNELRPGLEYVVVEERGPIHEPTFVVAVTLNDQKFVGEGRSKKQAKHQCAQKALQSFVQFRDALEGGQFNAMKMEPLGSGVDFTSDQLAASETSNLMTSFDAAGDDEAEKPTAKAGGDEAPPTEGTSAKRKADDDDSQQNDVDEAAAPPAKKPKISYTDKNPVMLLNELKPGLKYEMSESGESPATKRFIVSVGVEGKSFEGSGASKKLAKQACARAALTQLYDLSFTPHMSTGGAAAADAESGNDSDLVPGTNVRASEFSLPQPVADRIGNLVVDRFSGLIAGHAQHSRRKVLAGVVMTTDEEMDEMQVLTVSTGTKCVNGEHMALNGTALNDCHAEIISRRCLLDFLYRNLEMHLEDNQAKTGSVFVKDGTGFKLKENVRFHLYISTAPCGDARIFSPHEAPSTSESPAASGGAAAVDRHPNRKARGQLRTKIESGEGTIPVKPSEAVQTWDGVLQGSRLLTMSCSDKVAKWNVVGVQGALLSHFVDPVYFYSVTLGSLFHPDHMFRAVAGRFQDSLGALPSPFRVSVPKLNLLSSQEVRHPGKAPNYSVNWTRGWDDDRLEIVDATRGLEQKSGGPSRLAKISFFRRFLKLATGLGLDPERSDKLTQYNAAKMAAADYQKTKDAFCGHFRKTDLGIWVRKPLEQDEFVLERLPP